MFVFCVEVMPDNDIKLSSFSTGDILLPCFVGLFFKTSPSALHITHLYILSLTRSVLRDNIIVNRDEVCSVNVPNEKVTRYKYVNGNIRN